MIKVNQNTKITISVVNKLIKQYGTSDLIITLDNTKLQDPIEMQAIATNFPHLLFSVTGGLDPKKNKFDNEHYQRRTYFKAMELSKIIIIYRDIEKKISLTWNETQKAMFIYRELCNNMEYSEIFANGRDYSRGIGGLIYNQAVCSGFAMIYKEALDRIGLECYYQNREGHHSWNIAKLDGQYRALELTWDVYDKTSDGCGFRYFNRDKEDFYSNSHHNIDGETEERKFPIVPYTTERLSKDLAIINRPKVLKYKYNQSNEIKFKLKGEQITIKKTENEILFKNVFSLQYKLFKRNDGTSFIIIQDDKIENELYGHIIIEFKPYGVQIGKIFSEERLVFLPEEYTSSVANGLLSKDRLTRKINDFNGYVGYVGKNHGIYYSNTIEDKLNMRR